MDSDSEIENIDINDDYNDFTEYIKCHHDNKNLNNNSNITVIKQYENKLFRIELDIYNMWIRLIKPIIDDPYNDSMWIKNMTFNHFLKFMMLQPVYKNLINHINNLYTNYK